MTYSVVIPTFNNGDELRRAVESALGQSVAPAEVHVIDDCSTSAATAALLTELAARDKVIVRRPPHNMGASGARNVGIEMSTTPYVAFLDADDAWYVDKMEKQLTCLQRHDAVAVGARVATDVRALFEGRSVVNLHVRDLLTRHIIQTSTFVARRDALMAVGGFPHGRRFAEEGDLYLKLLAAGPVLFMNQPLVSYGDDHGLNESAGLSSQKWPMVLGELSNLKNCRARGQISPAAWAMYVALTLLRFSRRALLVRR